MDLEGVLSCAFCEHSSGQSPFRDIEFGFDLFDVGKGNIDARPICLLHT